MRKTLLTPLTLSLLLPAVAMAGHGKGACEEATIDQCLNTMVAKLKSTGFIGVELDQKTEDGPLIVTAVVEESPAQQHGIKIGDELVSLNGIPFGKETYEKMAEVKKPGKEVTCTIKRDGVSKSIKLTLAPMPADLMAKYIGEVMMKYAKPEQHASNP